MHMLAKNFPDQLAQKIKKDGLLEFGQALQYGKVYFGRDLDKGDYVTVEEYIEGNLVKYINNTVCQSDEGVCRECEGAMHIGQNPFSKNLTFLSVSI